MSKIAEFLTHFDDQHLANLQCAAEDGRLSYRDPCNCLVHHFRGEYSATKWDGDLAPLAREAENEFFSIGKVATDLFGAWIGHYADLKRRKAILPLIQAEWDRRAREKMPKQINEIAQFTELSPAVR